VLLIDETDKADIEIGPPAGGAVRLRGDRAGLGDHRRATVRPADLQRHARLSEALKRRCLFLHRLLIELERRILLSRVPSCPNICRTRQDHRRAAACSSRSCRRWLKPSTGAHRAGAGLDTIDDELTPRRWVVLKHQSDQIKASGELRLN
jgi:hypothetical protein